MQNFMSLGYMFRVLLAVSANFPDNPRTNQVMDLKNCNLQILIYKFEIAKLQC